MLITGIFLCVCYFLAVDLQLKAGSFVSEFSQDITDTQMGQVAPIVLPELYKIFLGAEVTVHFASMPC